MTNEGVTLVPIGVVVGQLHGEFPDVSVSKIRYLETQGLIQPQRTARGSRRYSAQDISTLRRILHLQRDEFLPLSVIKERLLTPDADTEVTSIATSRLRRSRQRSLSPSEVAHQSGISESTLEELQSFGLVIGLDTSAVDVGRAVARLRTYGIEPRHLRSFRVAADREIGLVGQALAPLTGSLSSAEVREEGARLLALLLDLHVALLRQRSSTLES
ncbi:MAG: MerR family transcriptional regulator [Candidatus Nanopelagicales bacterium]|nr:MerR family transcriptional regulator [Candidatus Nanopelagicales bacterium]MDP4715749.1 MerR family transcriptional regulator [Candidatus Nanopelagicales bacterium]MDP4906509.1 MerR family transcriptional regulator [Candidatus Nanopelagicales bacterium]MDP5095184.1 MerR family transcriptional regulator [Candidatus Nanopelagicales bacterium]